MLRLLTGGGGRHPIGFGWAWRSSLFNPNGGGRVCEALKEGDELAGDWGRMEMERDFSPHGKYLYTGVWKIVQQLDF